MDLLFSLHLISCNDRCNLSLLYLCVSFVFVEKGLSFIHPGILKSEDLTLVKMKSSY